MRSDPAPATAAPLLGEPVAVELMNTIWADRDGAHDALASTGEVRGWFTALADRTGPADLDPAALTLAAGAVDDAQVRRLRRLRDALRRIAAEAVDDPRERARSAVADLDEALAVVNETAAAAPHWSTLGRAGDRGFVLDVRTAMGRPDVIARFAEAGIALFADAGRAATLRACLAPGCVLYFVKDHPRREWCSAACGNRARVARHYERTRAATRP